MIFPCPHARHHLRQGPRDAGQVLAAITCDGFGIIDVSTKEADLEDVFLSLTRASNAAAQG